MAWAPIDTAPKDGTFILARIAEEPPVWVEWNEAWGHQAWFVVNGETFIEPTVWLNNYYYKITH